MLIAGDYDLFGLNRDDGASVWRFAPADGYGPGLYLGDAARGLVFAGSPAGRVYAVDHHSGRLQWSLAVGDEATTTVFEPAAAQTSVFAGYTTFSAPSTGGVVAIDVESGGVRWRTPFPAAHPESAATGFAGGLVLVDDIVIAGSGDGTIYALDSGDGTIRWSIAGVSTAASLPRPDFRALARSGRRLIAGSLSGVVVSYDLDTRRERWRLSAGRNGSVGFRIFADAQSVYVPYLSGCLVAIDADKGFERWRVGDEDGRFPWPPYASGDRVFAAGSSGLFSFHR